MECKISTHPNLRIICVGSIEVDWDKEPNMELLRQARTVHNMSLEDASIPDSRYSNARNGCQACDFPSLPLDITCRLAIGNGSF